MAVLPVTLFHAGFSLFSGGFVGVDVFFVISGYLITGILIREIQDGSFSLLSFYERRARRILPALFFVVLCCLPFAWSWLRQPAFVDFSESMIAVALFSSNILFWRETGYFAPAAEDVPLLHTWSLAVEEQFYIFFPLVLLVLCRWHKRTILMLITLGVLSSLALSEYGARFHPTGNFFLLPTRAWELGAGALCAFAGSRTVSPALGNLFSAAGLAAILVAIIAFDGDTPFPSLYALLPVLGTCAILLFALPGTFANALLSQISLLEESPLLPPPKRAARAVVSASRSKGWRKVATTSPFSQEQFESTKLRRRRFSRAGWRSNSACALRASSRIRTSGKVLGNRLRDAEQHVGRRES